MEILLNELRQQHPDWIEAQESALRLSRLLFENRPSMRDQFAMASLQGIKSNPQLCEVCSNVSGMTQQEAIAHMAFKDADAMIKVRGQ